MATINFTELSYTMFSMMFTSKIYNLYCMEAIELKAVISMYSFTFHRFFSFSKQSIVLSFTYNKIIILKTHFIVIYLPSSTAVLKRRIEWSNFLLLVILMSIKCKKRYENSKFFTNSYKIFHFKWWMLLRGFQLKLELSKDAL